ncbi:urease accessory protein UreF [Chromatocurvus halotolerans]|uniref:Urease accessory protein UreF n=1 Tax=Chromatocurvus halotolerans TaxID=1132028 RepID=A0A4R2KZ90_9GAMM|nr:urease accessory protein UreF [Chromatocurvus halotolerans]TCO78237.1 urease accessory protein [Chromatocurvus halotolerans]
MTTAMASTDSRLHLWHLISPALPVGAYAYSQGLEFAIEAGWLSAPEALDDWLAGLLSEGLARSDLPVLLRCLDAWQLGDVAALDHWNDWLRASRETRELLLEDEQMGVALFRLLNDLGVPDMPLRSRPGYVSQFARACAHWQISAADTLHGYAWSWLENQVTAATKLIPLGQTMAQKHLLALMPGIAFACMRATALADDELGGSLPGLAMASAAHEQQHARLFRS